MRATRAGLALASFVAVAIAAGCHPDAAPAPDYANLPGGNPLVPEVAAYPFPADFYLTADSSTRTGRRISIPSEALTRPGAAAVFSGADGFSRAPLILAYLPGGFDPTSLPASPAATLRRDASALLVRVGSQEQLPILVETDLTEQRAQERALIIRPLRALDAAAGYVVILRDTLRRADGQPHRAGAAFAALRDGLPTSVQAIERQRDDFKRVDAAISALSLQRQRVVLAWSFHTRSEAETTATLLAMQDHAATAPLGGYTVASDTVETSGRKTNRQLAGTFQAPSFIGADGLIHRDAKGQPRPVGQRDVPFRLTIPSTVQGPRPLLLFGHGIFGSPRELTHGSFNDLCTERRFSAVGAHLGLNETNQAQAIMALTADLSRLDQVVADIQQGVANYTTLARLARAQLARDLTTGAGERLTGVVDPGRVHYMGISNGGNLGFVVAATSPRLSRAVMVAGGGGLMHALQRAVFWSNIGPVIKITYPESRERQLMLSLLQGALDPVDGISYAARLVHNRFPGRGPLRAAIHMAVNDSAVSNLSTEWVARTAGLPLVTPSPRAVYGLETISAPLPGGTPTQTRGALFVYDERAAPGPSGNLPPTEDNGTHEGFRELGAYKRQVAEFIESGKLVQVCNGACDPD